MDLDGILPVLGSVAARVARDWSPGTDPAVLSRVWASMVDRAGLRIFTDAALDVLRLPVGRLTRGESDLDEDDPSLLFAEQVARYVAALPTRDVATQAVELLELGQRQNDEYLRKMITSQALRVFEASAEHITAQAASGSVEPVREVTSRLKVAALRDEALRSNVIDVLHSWQAQTATWVPLNEQGQGPLDNLGLDLSSVVAELDTLPAAESPVEEGAGSDGQDLERSRSASYLNVGFDKLGSAGTSRSRQDFDPGEECWLWVEIGPQSPESVSGIPDPFSTDELADGSELEVVVFADESIEVSPSLGIGTLRVVQDGSFPVVSRAVTTLGEPKADGLLEYRLYARVKLPGSRGVWRLRVAVFVKGVLLHVQQVSVPVGTGAAPRYQTAYQLGRGLSDSDDYASLTTPALTIYANASDETHDFAFYLPRGGEEPSLKTLIHLEATAVQTFTDDARRRLRFISWGSEDEITWDEEPESQPNKPTFRLSNGTFGTAKQVEDALIHLAVGGRHLWQEFANRMEHSESNQAFRNALRQLMEAPGAVQLAIKESPDLVIPLQLLYDRRLDTSSPDFLHICSATKTWLESPVGDPPCLTKECPDAANDQRVCVAGFWGYRHAISITPPHADGWQPVVRTSAPPRATVARSTDPGIDPYWTSHQKTLNELVDAVPREPARTSAEVFTSLKFDQSVLAYFLAHVVYEDGVPKILLDKLNGRGALNATTVDSAELDLSSHRPLIFINACASAGLSPARLLGLINAFMDAGAGGAVGTEITVFVDFAVSFAEQMLAEYAAGTTLGESLRHARLELLRQRNPLGLVYVAFGLHDLRLVLDAAPAA